MQHVSLYTLNCQENSSTVSIPALLQIPIKALFKARSLTCHSQKGLDANFAGDIGGYAAISSLIFHVDFCDEEGAVGEQLCSKNERNV